MELSVDSYQSFVVRVLTHDGILVQGQITHIATRDSARFKETTRMIEFILDHLQISEEKLMPEAAGEGV